jgi:hypothetical protein
MSQLPAEQLDASMSTSNTAPPIPCSPHRASPAAVAASTNSMFTAHCCAPPFSRPGTVRAASPAILSHSGVPFSTAPRQALCGSGRFAAGRTSNGRQVPRGMGGASGSVWTLDGLDRRAHDVPRRSLAGRHMALWWTSGGALPCQPSIDMGTALTAFVFATACGPPCFPCFPAAFDCSAPSGRVCRQLPRVVADSPASTSAPSRSFQMASSSAEGAVPIRPAGGLGKILACVCAALTGSLLLLLPRGHAARPRLARQQLSVPRTLSTVLFGSRH